MLIKWCVDNHAHYGFIFICRFTFVSQKMLFDKLSVKWQSNHDFRLFLMAFLTKRKRPKCRLFMRYSRPKLLTRLELETSALPTSVFSFSIFV